MTKPVPDQTVFEFEQDILKNPFISEESFTECQDRMKSMKEDRAVFGYSRSPGMSGISQRSYLNRSPTLKGKQKWALPLDLSTGNSLHTSIKVD